MAPVGPVHPLARARLWLDHTSLALAAGLPALEALARAANGPQWRDDATMVRAGALALGDGQGCVSTALVAASSLVPIGSWSFRAAAVSALAAGVCGALLFRLTRRLLASLGPACWREAPLAAAASLCVTLGASAQVEATVGGGATIAAALVLAGLLLAGRRPSAGAAIGLGATAAACAFEDVVALAALAAVVGAARLASDRPVGPARRVRFGAALVPFGALLVTAPVLVASLAGARSLAGSSPGAWWSSLTVTWDAPCGAAAWLDDVGPLAAAAAGAGIVYAMARRATRAVSAPLVALVALDVVARVRAAEGSGFADPTAALRLLSCGALAACAALALHAFLGALLRSRLPMTRPAAALVGAGALTLVAIAAEGGERAGDRRSQSGATAWGDSAWLPLPPRALLVARSRRGLLRAAAARVVAGERDDVLVVSPATLAHGSVAGALLAREPAAAALVRDVASTGAPGEYALSRVADRRPVFLEFVPDWGKHVAAHLAPDSLRLRYWPQPLGAGERRAGEVESQRAAARVREAARRRDAPADEATLDVLADASRDETNVALVLGDDDGAERSLVRLLDARPGDPFVEHTRARLLRAKPAEASDRRRARR